MCISVLQFQLFLCNKKPQRVAVNQRKSTTKMFSVQEFNEGSQEYNKRLSKN